MQCAICKFVDCCGREEISCNVTTCKLCFREKILLTLDLCSKCSFNNDKCFSCSSDIHFNEKNVQTYVKKLEKLKINIIRKYYGRDCLDPGPRRKVTKYCDIICRKLEIGKRNFYNFDADKELKDEAQQIFYTIYHSQFLK